MKGSRLCLTTARHLEGGARCHLSLAAGKAIAGVRKLSQAARRGVKKQKRLYSDSVQRKNKGSAACSDCRLQPGLMGKKTWMGTTGSGRSRILGSKQGEKNYHYTKASQLGDSNDLVACGQSRIMGSEGGSDRWGGRQAWKGQTHGTQNVDERVARSWQTKRLSMEKKERATEMTLFFEGHHLPLISDGKRFGI